ASRKFTKSSVTSVTSNRPKSPNTQSPKSPSPQLTSETKINDSHQDESTKDAWLSEDEDVEVACMPDEQDPDEDKQDKKKPKKKKKKKRDWTWKITRYSCLGVLTCNNEGCQWAGTPPTCRLKLEQLPKTIKTMTCPGLGGHCLGKPSGAHCPPDQVNTKLQPQEDHLHDQFTVLESDLAHLDEETLTQSAVISPTDPCKSREVSEAPEHEVYEAPMNGVCDLTHPFGFGLDKQVGGVCHCTPPRSGRAGDSTPHFLKVLACVVEHAEPKRPRPKKLGTVRLKSQETKSISAKVLPEPKETQTDSSNVLPERSESETISSLEHKTSEPISEKGKIIIRFKVKASSTQPDQALDPIPSCVKPAPPKSAPNERSVAIGTRHLEFYESSTLQTILLAKKGSRNSQDRFTRDSP
ncbi:hypothetical protein PSTT_03158, partial [Puccinia striiformis]